ncbi:MAG: TonB-dependent receptor [Acidobacteriia bacterium]|nr:TonB-dependent receptor [Terriglobia bacterium]
MRKSSPQRIRVFRLAALLILACLPLAAAEHHGLVTFGGLPVPGATVTASQGEKRVTAITDQLGFYSFADLPDGIWSIRVEMLCFAPLEKEIAVAPGAPSPEWELKLMPVEEMRTEKSAPAPVGTDTGTNAGRAGQRPAPRKGGKPAPQPANTSTAFQRAGLNASAEAEKLTADPETQTDELKQSAADGFLINGSVNNGANSPFAQAAAFGNFRKFGRSLYNGNLGLLVDNSALDARPFSLTGQNTPRPAYNRMTAVGSFGGPLKISRLWSANSAPMVTVNYQWTRNSNATTATGLMPSAAERAGSFSQPVFDPADGSAFPNNSIPRNRIANEASALLPLYPGPNFANSRYNYQVPLLGAVHQDALQARVNKSLGRRDQINTALALQSMRSDSATMFDFLDLNGSLGINASAGWRRSFTSRVYGSLTVQYSRLSARATPYFANRRNISGDAGVTGNNQEPVNWGPPALSFGGGIAPLADIQASFTRNQTTGVSYSLTWVRREHNFNFGGDFRRQQFNALAQQDPRGSFAFTGAAAGVDFADFLLGIPDTSAIAFGNADKYFRSSVYDAYFTDDWRVGANLSLNAGIRWDYTSPITERYGRLVNLDIAPGFVAQAPVVAAEPAGPLTGARYPDSLLRPYKAAFQPRIGFAWRPLSASSLLIRGGYGVYYDASVYQGIAMQLAQQSPLSKSLSVQNSPANPLTLANGFVAAPNITLNTFAVDPGFRPGYAQNWQISAQRDLPGGMVAIASYLGVKGTHARQQFLPNTYPLGAANPCPICLSGYGYLISGGNSNRQAGQLQLRRRLRNGFTAGVQYAFSKAIDDATLGGGGQGALLIAQNWLDLQAERALSSFDQRHLVNANFQYSTGTGLRGGTLMSGWRGGLFKDWTIASQITAGSGFPLTPVYFAPVKGTGMTGSIRPQYTGAPLYAAPPGLFLNPAAYAAPSPGQWGNAGRDSITGPAQFALNASLMRAFRLTDRFTLDLRVDATNALNDVTYPSWNTTAGSVQFGLPMTANAMRTVQTNLRVRF